MSIIFLNNLQTSNIHAIKMAKASNRDANGRNELAGAMRSKPN